MATISRRTGKNGKVSYQAKIRLKGYPTYSASFSRLTDANLWVKKTEVAVREETYSLINEAQKHTLAELIDRYTEVVLPAKRTAKDQLRQLAHWKTKLGHLRLSAVTPSVIATEREALKKGITNRGGPRSNATVARYMASLSHVFTVGVREWQWVADNPFSKVSKPRVADGRTRFLSEIEKDRLLEECKSSTNRFLYPAVVLALSTGARRGELLGLTWPDVDLEVGRITLRNTKNSDTRALPLWGLALNLMKGLHSERVVGLPWVFPGRNNRKSGEVGPIDLRAPWLDALERAGIKDFRWHDLRHSAASYLAMNGASLNEIAAILGHRQLSMVQRYAHLSEQHTAGVVERMNEKIFGKVVQ